MTENTLSQPTDTRLAGVVGFHDDRGGFGKIDAEDGTQYFFHATACRGASGGNTFRTMIEGKPVTFAPRETDKGPRAFAVRVDAAAETRARDAARGNR